MTSQRRLRALFTSLSFEVETPVHPSGINSIAVYTEIGIANRKKLIK
jgi:hypothetical protein